MDHEAAFNELNSLTSEALQVAEDALKAAAASQHSAPVASEVKLVKVAAARYASTADVLVKSGAFPGKTADDIARNLKDAGEAGYLDLLEKLASTAIFPLTDVTDVLGGDLVEKAAKPSGALTPGSKASSTARWQTALDETAAEMANA